MKNYSVRTDLALEEKERFASDNVEVQGVVLEEEYDEENEIRLTRVVIETENGAKIMGKPIGIYLTLESPDLALEVEENSRVLQERICDCIRELIFHKISCEDGKELKILFVGLGNRAVTPDALGPYVADHLEVNRHIVKEYGKYAMRTEQLIVLSAIVPGVMGQTGMETAEIVRGIVHETKPDLILAVDALAARNSRRLNRTIQIADTGITPGSGVGNAAAEITEKSLGVPVIDRHALGDLISEEETATLPHIAYCSVGNADGTLPLLRCEAITVDEIKLGSRAVALAEHPLGDGGAYAGLWCEGCEKGEKHGELAQNAVA